MKYHLGYCTNIHTGESWEDHFAVLQENIPSIKAQFSPKERLGLGLRLANQASMDLEKQIPAFKQWLKEQEIYVFTMNGFPYGEFHDTVVKDKVHAPDWTYRERVDYTLRLFRILAEIIPEDLTSAGISTSPLSYKYWWSSEADKDQAIRTATLHMLEVLAYLVALKTHTGKSFHLDIEPEPDGLLENGSEFLHWYQAYLLPLAKGKFTEEQVKEHIQLCYDVCHFAVGFEKPSEMVQQLAEAGIKTGKIQVSSALKVVFNDNEEEKIRVLSRFNEPTYLHQVVGLRLDGSFEAFRDLGEALAAFKCQTYKEWRIHFHVPLFAEDYELLQSTQSDILDTFKVLEKTQFTDQLEIETYTWGVLPSNLQKTLNESIVRELLWVQNALKHE